MARDSLKITERQPDAVLAAAKDLARSFGWSVEESPNQLKMKTPASLRSWGETITLDVERDPQLKASVNVTVSSSPNLQLFDWGKSSQNIDLFLKQLREKMG